MSLSNEVLALEKENERLRKELRDHRNDLRPTNQIIKVVVHYADGTAEIAAITGVTPRYR